MEIIQYQNKYRQQVIDLILHIQNDEAKIDLQIEEQQDLRRLAKKNCHSNMNILTGTPIYIC